MTIDEIREEFKVAVDKARADGFEFTQGTFGTYSAKDGCLIAAYGGYSGVAPTLDIGSYDEEYHNDTTQVDSVCKRLGISRDQLRMIMAGFDNEDDGGSEFNNLGSEFAREIFGVKEETT